jgi:hypothetical protein
MPGDALHWKEDDFFSFSNCNKMNGTTVSNTSSTTETDSGGIFSTLLAVGAGVLILLLLCLYAYWTNQAKEAQAFGPATIRNGDEPNPICPDCNLKTVERFLSNAW